MTIRNPGLGRRPEPVGRRDGEPGAPVSAHLIANLNKQTEAFWSSCNGSRHSWHWPDPDTSPVNTASATATAKEYRIGDLAGEDARFEIPWFMQDGFGRVRLQVLLVGSFSDQLEFSMHSDDLINAVDQVEGSWRTPSLMGSPPVGRWHRSGADPWRMYRLNITHTPIVDATGKCAFHFEFRVPDEAIGIYTTAVGFTSRIYSMQIMDLPAEAGGLY